ncbi:guanylate kinase [Dyella sp. 20L07]|uniref:guanylate kinase n=1 Tax=Dyella sp. 20L07 TaxID=3384240 RepID=UPI003D28183B
MNAATSQPPSVEGTLFVVAAPSGAGKSSLVNALLELEPAISLSISHTTRPPRPGEQYGRHYYFVERAEFEREIAEGIFLEHAEVHSNLYGTSRTTVNTLLEQGRDVLLEIDWQGARQIRKSKPDCVSVFILPPSRPELERRLRGRASDSPEVIARRLHNSREEIAHAHEFDYIIVNDRFEDALTDLQAIVHAVRQRAGLQWQRHEALISELLA